MTYKTYKLVPVEPTAAMLQVGKHSAPYRAIDVYRAMIKVAPEPACKEPPVAWWNGMPASPLEGTPPSIRWGADAEDTHHDIPLYAGFNPVHTRPPEPEPVCRWTLSYGWNRMRESGYFIPGCLHDEVRMKLKGDDYCPHCGKKVEVVDDE